MRQKKIQKVLLGTASLLAAGALAPAYAATDALDIKATVIDPVSVTATQSLSFGSLTEAGVGTLAVNAANPAGLEGGGVTSIGGTIQVGQFAITGNPTSAVKVTVPASAILTNGTDTMTVNAFTLEGGASPYTHTIGGGGSDTGLTLGGTLNVGAGQATGNYTGTVTLTAVYN